MVNADRDQVGQVVMNLLLNAMHALENVDQGEISIHMHKTGGSTFLSIVDHGIGIPPARLKDVFIPFFSTREGGSSIRLSLSRLIMRNHGGQISVVSASFFTKFELVFRDEAQVAQRASYAVGECLAINWLRGF